MIARVHTRKGEAVAVRMSAIRNKAVVIQDECILSPTAAGIIRFPRFDWEDERLAELVLQLHFNGYTVELPETE